MSTLHRVRTRRARRAVPDLVASCRTLTSAVEILIERRRLGQTDLHVKPGQVGLNNATKAENLGIFDYAHLRVPLPPNLKGSGIFAAQKASPFPESYFLMVRFAPYRPGGRAEKDCGMLTKLPATKQRRLHKRDWDVQGRFPLGIYRRRAEGAETPQDPAHCRTRGSRGQRLDLARTRFVTLAPQYS